MGSTSVMNLLLGWLKSMARWVLGLFDLAGSSGFSPLKWLSENWLSMLVVLLIAGVVIDLLVWLFRWRPYWIWFNKKRIVIDDERFFEGEELVDSGLYDPSLFTGSDRRRAPVDRASSRGNARRKYAPAGKRSSDPDDIFDVSSSAYHDEDEVFNVSDLPVSRDELAFRNSQRNKNRR